MKKIGLFLGTASSNGGMFQYSQAVLDAIASLPRDKFSVVVAYVSSQWKSYLEKYSLASFHLGKAGAKYSFSNIWRVTGLPVGMWRAASPYFNTVAGSLVRAQCDLWVFPAQDSWSFMAPVPSLVSIHDLMHRYEKGFPEVSAHGAYFRREHLFRNISRWAKGIIVDSRVGKLHVHESYQVPLERIFELPYIPPGYIYETGIAGDFSEKYQLPGKFIFYPAQFWGHKNHTRLVEAVAKVKTRHPDIFLVLAGARNNAYDEITRKVKTLELSENVIFLGHVPDRDMPELYRRACAMVMPTFFGPTNIPPLEAFALGCPVAVSNIYGMPEQAGDAALLFNPNSADEIAGCIERLWSDDSLRASLITKGRAHATAWGQKQFNQTFLAIVEASTAC